ncbi:hypothetical protein CR920_08445 [Stenotrophomonas indicatrix]|uniref:transporter n=1 Tax=Stenotrophomonas indicatrix TaxID=2045451 RepID=UPI000C190965|nr:transporter [Stenotrophomonas indicatrix]PII15825.1 hypothetical protein CR920_08445 [Stenotrophomonas indicatrix]
MKFWTVKPYVYIVTAVFLWLFSSFHAQAQDDGARGYQLAPVGTHQLTLQYISTHGNRSLDDSVVIPGADIDVNVGVLQYTQTFSAGPRSLAVFGVLPFGQVKASVDLPSQVFTTKSSGLGDAQAGVVLGLVGAPALGLKEYVSYKPGFSLGLLGKVFVPTGEYTSSRAVNLGTNRYAYQIGLPISYAIGNSYLDPNLTTFDLLPTVTFYGSNDDPFGANKTAQDEIYGIEGHVTRGLTKGWWISGDLLYRYGGETETDGISDNKTQRSLAVGATTGIAVSASSTLKLTYGKIVSRNENGKDGWMARAVLAWVF